MSKEIIAKIDEYLDKVQARIDEDTEDTYAPKLLNILNEYRAALENPNSFDPRMKNGFYDAVKYGATFWGQNSIASVGVHEGPSLLLMKDFLKDLPPTEYERRITEKDGKVSEWSWKLYSEQALIPALEWFEKEYQKQRLIQIIDKYITSLTNRFKKEPDFFASDALKILKAYRDVLTSYSVNEFNAYFRIYGNVDEASSGSYPSLVLVNQCLDELLKTGYVKDYVESLMSYRENITIEVTKYNQILEQEMAIERQKALELEEQRKRADYERRKGDALLMTSESKIAFRTAFVALEDSLLVSLKVRMEKFAEAAANENLEFRKAYREKGLTWDMLYSLRDVTGELAKDHAEAIKIINFMYPCNQVIKADKISAHDVKRLHPAAKTFKDSLLKMPEMNEVTQYGWLVNLVCNFINRVYQFFEPENKGRENTNRFFYEVDQQKDNADQKIEDVGRNFPAK